MANHDKGGTTFSVDGGAGSISYTLAEIAESGVKLGRLAQLMEPLADRLAGEWVWLCQAAAGTAPYPFAASDAMRDAMWSFRRAQADTAALAAKATQAGANYAATEARNAAIGAQLGGLGGLRDGLNAWALGPLMSWRVALDVAGQLGRASSHGARDVTEGVLNKGPSYAAGLLGPGPAALHFLALLRRQDVRNSGVAQAHALRTFFDATGLATPGQLQVRRVPVQEWRPRPGVQPQRPGAPPPGQGPPALAEPHEMAASIRGVLDGSKDAYGYPPGSISVVQVGRPDGTIAWVVHLPGTEDWSTIDSVNPFDMEGNVEALTAAGQQQFQQERILVQELIRAALKTAGATPAQEVLITGHSGGGIHAAAAAASPAFLVDVNVKMVVIAGAPAKNQHVQPGIAVLDLQNEHDIVTAADFGAPPAEPNWVTVTSHRPNALEGEDLGSVLAQAHSVENYVEDAAALDSSQDRAIVDMRERLAVFLGVGAGVGATVQGVKTVYQGRDVNNPPATVPRTGNGPAKPKPGVDYSPGAR
ncbi:hypothetical protein ACX80E_10075 [Arthrobacter sp. TMN-49]